MSTCVFGDSIVWGEGDIEKGGWCERLKVFLYQKNPDTELYNLGISGDITENLLKRLESETINREGKEIIISIGINDSQITSGKERVGIDNFRKNFENIMHVSKRLADKMLVVGLTCVDEEKTTPIPWSTTNSYTNLRIEEFDRVVRAVSKREKVTYVPVFDLLTIKDLSDGLHPNPQGHKKIFEKIKRYL